MVTVHGYSIQYMATVYGYSTWLQYMVVVYGYNIWLQYMVTVYIYGCSVFLVCKFGKFNQQK